MQTLQHYSVSHSKFSTSPLFLTTTIFTYHCVSCHYGKEKKYDTRKDIAEILVDIQRRSDVEFAVSSNWNSSTVPAEHGPSLLLHLYCILARFYFIIDWIFTFLFHIRMFCFIFLCSINGVDILQFLLYTGICYYFIFGYFIITLLTAPFGDKMIHFWYWFYTDVQW